MSPSIMLRQPGVARRFCEIAAGFQTRVPTWMLLAFPLLPSAAWYVRRLDDGSDEPYGLIPLALAVLLAWRDRGDLKATAGARTLGAVMVLFSVLLIPVAPPMIRAALAVTGSGILLGMHRPPALLGLLALSLPVVASLQFYAGYPLRLATAGGAAHLLQTFGVTVERSGVELGIAGSLVGVDPACAGVRMMWQGLIAAMALAAYHRLSWRATAMAGMFAFLLVIPANMVRAALLALDETGRLPHLGLGHGGIGLICFLAIIAPLALWIPRHAGHVKTTAPSGESPLARPALACACLMAPLLLSGPARDPAPPLLAGGMPETFSFGGLTLPLEPQTPTREEAAFSRSFPGSIGVFRRDRDQVIMRRVTQATRRLHPAADCLRAAGYHTGDSVTVRLGDGTTWSRFHATGDGQRLTVHERIVSESNAATWTDVPAWYWSALRRPLNGPWRAETLISR